MLWSLSKYVSATYTQFFPPAAQLTERNLPSQAGRVFVVTGGNSGLGAELVRILYNAGGTVYIATRDAVKSKRVMGELTGAAGPTAGTLKFLQLDLTDLASVKAAAADFLSNETRLDVLWNNAGVGGVAETERTKQGLEMHHGVNAVAPLLFAKLLMPALAAAAAAPAGDAEPGAVRVVWTGSMLVELGAPEGGVDLADLGKWTLHRNTNYAASRAGNYFLASEFHRRLAAPAGVVSLVQNPGSLRTPVWRNASIWEYGLFWPLFGSALDGAHTALWAGLDPSVTLADGGRYAIPWGRWHSGQRPDIVNSLKDRDEGGSGMAKAYYDWCEETVAPFA